MDIEVDKRLELKLRNWIDESLSNGKFSYSKNDTPLFELGTNIGLVRQNNEDRLASLWVNGGGESDRCFFCAVLCDGMGGMKQGGESASIAISSFLSKIILGRKLIVEERLYQAAVYANNQVNQLVSGGGSTLSAVIIEGGSVYSLNIGDSRIYSVSRSIDNRLLKRHTTDDNMKEAFGDEGNALIQYIGLGDGLRPHIDKILPQYDWLMLTSDGVHELEESVLSGICLNSN